MVTAPGERFVLRDETGQRTVGGGYVLLVDAQRHRRGDPDTSARLLDLDAADPGGRAEAYLELCSDLGAPVAELARGVGMPMGRIAELVAHDDRFLRVGPEDATAIWVARRRYDRYTSELLSRVRAHHRDVTSAPGLESELLRQSLIPRVDARVFRAIVDRLCVEGVLERRAAVLAEPGHAVRMSAQAERSADAVLAHLCDAGSMPPSLSELQERHRLAPTALQEVLGVLVDRGRVVKVSSELYFAKSSVEGVGETRRRFLEREGLITPAGFRDLIAASRKYTIPLLDYFDRSGLTGRSGDYRRLL